MGKDGQDMDNIHTYYKIYGSLLTLFMNGFLMYCKGSIKKVKCNLWT